ncbi:hypothetical protein GCM10018793_50920 [Streptomyces sulfonofaciens]|uniref:SCO6045-like C-terminal domain-containing protein n=1 Tax=Streptomyces sulfonofaciens TaxID=68272 RepID=A0A919L5R3_9ACTN|nr:DUF692 domain-containing protein [Streptomyces sulfonofaciens]GHH84912.1 hypothetical protein GCM10018793_50920 [Streptomyces sulfonofaciens]
MERLGTGIGWRPEIAEAVERMPGIDWVEAVAENVCPDHLPEPLLRLRERGVTVVPHGVGLGLGGAERPDPRRLADLAARAEALRAPLVTEHIAFVRAGGELTASQRLEAGHLLPVPRTRDALAVLCENVRIAQDALPVPLAVENIAALFGWPADELTEGQFLSELVERTGVRLLIDVANLHTNHVNRGEDPAKALDELPVEAIAYVHVAGGHERDGVWHDTHAHPVSRPVLDVLADLASRTVPPGVLLERDEDFPAPAELEEELRAIRAVIATAGPVGRRTTGPARRDTAEHTLRGGGGSLPPETAEKAQKAEPVPPHRAQAASPQGAQAVSRGSAAKDRQTVRTTVGGGAAHGTRAAAGGAAVGAPGAGTGAGTRTGAPTAATTGRVAPPRTPTVPRARAAAGTAPGSTPSGTPGSGTAPAATSATSATEPARQRLGLEQAALLSSLVAGTPVPEGFDRGRLALQGRALAGKRADVVAKVAPELPGILGAAYRSAFLSYAHTRPMTGGYRRDALDFAEHLLLAGRPHDSATRRRLTAWWLERSGPNPPSGRAVARMVRAARLALQRV